MLETSPGIEALWNREQQAKSKCCTAAIESGNMIDDCSIPKYDNAPQFDVPCCVDNEINMLLTKYRCLFKTVPGVTTLTYHHIPSLDQSACTITTALIKLFSVLGMPDVVHSD